MKGKFCTFFISVFLVIAAYGNGKATKATDVDVDEVVTAGAQIMEHLFCDYGDDTFLIKYRNDKKFIGVLLLDDKNVGHTLQVFDMVTSEKIFEYSKADKQIVNFQFKRNAVIIYYKSSLWEEKIAYDLYTGRVVRRYSSWFGYNK